MTSRSIRRPSILAFSLVLAAVVGIFGSQFWGAYRSGEEMAAATAENLAAVVTYDFEGVLRRAEGDLRTFVQILHPEDLTSAVSESRREEIETVLGLGLKNRPELHTFRIFDAAGSVLYSPIHSKSSFNVADREWFQSLRDNPGVEKVISEVLHSKIDGTPLLIFGIGMRRADGAFAGAAVATINLSEFQKKIDTLAVGPKGVLALRRTDTRALTLRHPERSEVINEPTRSALMDRVLAGETAGTGELVSPVDQVRRRYAFRKMASYPFVTIVGLARDDYASSWLSQSVTMGSVTAGLLLILFFLFLNLVRSQDRISGLASALTSSEERYRSLVEDTTDWVWETDENNRFSWFSSSFERVVGISAASLLGKSRLDAATLGRKMDQARWREHLADLEARRSFRDFRYWIRAEDKSAKWISVSGSPRFDAHGRFVGYRGSGSEISEKAALSARLRMFSKVVEQSPVSVMVTDGHGTITYVNAHFTAVTGYSSDELIGRKPNMFSLRQSGNEGEGSLWATLAQGRMWTGELRNHRKNGEMYWESVVISSVKNEDGEIENYVAIAEDITVRKETEAAQIEHARLLRHQYESLRALNDIAALPHAGADRQLVDALALGARHLDLAVGIISRLDGERCTILYHSPPDGGSLGDGQCIPHGDTCCAMTLSANDVVAIPNVANSPHGCQSALGQQAYIGAPVMVRGEVFGTVSFGSPHPYGRDFDEGDLEFMRLLARWVGVVVERAISEQELRTTQGELAESNAELEQFAYVASHDLRQPLRMINSYLSLLETELGPKLDGETKSYMDFATGGAKRMDALIVGLLNYSRAGRGLPDFRLLPLSEVVAESVWNLQVAITEAQAEIVVAPDLPQVMGDRMSLVRLFQNLIGNAVKYRVAERLPKIEVGWRAEPERLVFWVRDNGLGIDPQYHDRLFGIFQRLVTREQYEGTGIGLAICRKLVEHHGGGIWVESALGTGSTFLFSLPQAGGR